MFRFLRRRIPVLNQCSVPDCCFPRLERRGTTSEFCIHHTCVYCLDRNWRDNFCERHYEML